MPTSRTTTRQVFELYELIGAPLAAAIDADATAAIKFANFLVKYGFEPDPENHSLGALKMVSFEYTYPSGEGPKTAVAKIPLLSLLPLPVLQMDIAEFHFNVRLLGGSQDETRSAPSLDTTGEGSRRSNGASPLRENPHPFRMHAAMAQLSRSDDSAGASHTTANMKIKVSMRQADMPAGLSSLLQLMSESVHTSMTT